MFRRLDKFDGPIFGGGGGAERGLEAYIPRGGLIFGMLIGLHICGAYIRGGFIYGGHMTLTTLKFTNNARVMELPYRMSKQFLVLHLIWNSI